jgi:hypothetical protein
MSHYVANLSGQANKRGGRRWLFEAVKNEFIFIDSNIQSLFTSQSVHSVCGNVGIKGWLMGWKMESSG